MANSTDPAISTDSAKTAPALPVTVHPLVWAIQLWVVATVTSLLLSAGLRNALRGAYVGAGSTIIHVDHAAALTSQVAAISTTLLLIYAGLMSARAAKSLMLGAGAALLGSVPTLMVFYAHRFTMPQIYTWISAACAASVLILCATQARTNTAVRTIVACGGLVLASAALRAFEFGALGSPDLTRVGILLQSFFSWCTVLLVMALHLSVPRLKALRGAVLFGATVLLAATASASTEPNVPRWILLTGRALHELTAGGVMGAAGALTFSSALLVLFSALWSRPTSLAQVVCAILALCAVSPLSPLTIATMTLCGYWAVIICWVPDTTRSSSPGVASSHLARG